LIQDCGEDEREGSTKRRVRGELVCIATQMKVGGRGGGAGLPGQDRPTGSITFGYGVKVEERGTASHQRLRFKRLPQEEKPQNRTAHGYVGVFKAKSWSNQLET